MSATYRNLVLGVLISSLPLIAGCGGCNQEHRFHPRVNEILNDGSLSDRELLKQLAMEVFQWRFGDSVGTNIQKGDITLHFGKKEFEHEALTEAKDVLAQRTDMPEEYKIKLQSAKQYAYKMIAKQMEEYLTIIGDRPLKGIVYRLGHTQHQPKSRYYFLLEIRLTNDNFEKLKEVVGRKGANIEKLKGPEVIETLNTVWKLQENGFPIVNAEDTNGGS